MPETAIAVVEETAQELATRGMTTLEKVQALTVTDVASHQAMAAYSQLGAMMEKEIHALMDPICEAAHQAHKVATAKRGDLLKMPTEIKRLAAQKTIAFEREVERKNREAQEAARREQARLEAEAAALAVEEQKRLREKAEEERLSQAIEAEARGDIKAATAIIEAPIVLPTVQAAPVFAPTAVVVPVPKAEGVSVRQDWTFEIENLDLVPRTYLIANEVAIRQVVRALNDKHGIPGVRAFQRDIPSTKV